MRCMILGAGLGTRLRPLTDHTPKILVPVLGVPMLGRLLAYLHQGGLTTLAMNTHHLAEAVEIYLAGFGGTHPALPRPRLFHEDVLLGTGGGLRNVAQFWGNDPLLVWNGDILADLPPALLANVQAKAGAAVTLAVQDRQGSSKLLVDEAGWLVGINSARRGLHRLVRDAQGATRPLAFQGISLATPALRQHMPADGVFDLIDVLLDAVEDGLPVNTLEMGHRFWGSSGTPAQLELLETGLQQRPDLLEDWSLPPQP